MLLDVTGAMAWALILGFSLSARIPSQGVSWDYTTWLNIVFGLLGVALCVRFFGAGGLAMLRMMGGSPRAWTGATHRSDT